MQINEKECSTLHTISTLKPGDVVKHPNTGYWYLVVQGPCSLGHQPLNELINLSFGQRFDGNTQGILFAKARQAVLNVEA